MRPPRPVPPGHQTYPRAPAAGRDITKRPDPAPRPVWQRNVPELRSFPRR